MIDLKAVADRERAMERWRRAGAPPPRPLLIPWQLIHGACDQDRDWRLTYTISAKQLRHERGILLQTMQLWSKPWAKQTGWQELVVRILVAQP